MGGTEKIIQQMKGKFHMPVQLPTRAGLTSIDRHTRTLIYIYVCTQQWSTITIVVARFVHPRLHQKVPVTVT